MFTFDRPQRSKRTTSNLALAIALATGTALTLGAVAEPAHAQRKKKKDEAPKTDFTKEFVEAYQEADTLRKNGDAAGAKSMIPGVLAAAKTGDDKNAAGGFLFNVGQALSDIDLQRQGFDLIIESGKLSAENYPVYLVNSGDLARQAGDMEFARKRFIEAHEAGYTKDDLPSIIAGTYFQEDRIDEGLTYLSGLIDAQIAAGETPNSGWIDLAFIRAYNNDKALEAINFAALAVKYDPSEKNWRNAIAVQRNLIDMKSDVQLDLMRLAERTNTLQDGRDFADYIEAADPRRLPGEVKRVLEAALAANALEADDPFVIDAREMVNSNYEADKADLPSHARDARKPESTALIATVAGDVFLSHGDAATAEEMYTIAATKPGADKNKVMTRLGIAQVDQGKYAEAQESFANIGGSRGPLSALWSAYASAASEPAPTREPMTETAEETSAT